MIIENIDSSKIEKVTNQIEIMVQSIQPDYVKREFKIKNKEYTYHGPENNETATLLQMLSQMESKSNESKQSFFSKLYKIYLDKEKEWNLEKSILDKNFSVGLNEIIKTIVYWSAFFSVVGESTNIKNDPLLERDQTRQSIAQYMPLYAFLYTFFSQIFQQIHYKIIWLILFICLIIIPTLVMIGYHFDLFSGSFHFSGDYVGLALCITSISIFINSFLNKIFFYLIKKVSNELIATLFNCSLCILISYFMLFKIIAFVLLLKTNNFVYIINSIADLIAPSLFIQVFFLSIFLLKRLFLIRPRDIIRELNFINNQQYPEDRLKKQYINYLTNNKIANFFQKTKCDSIGQLFFSAAYASFQIYFYIHLIIDLKSPVINFGNVISYSFLLFASPIYIVIGIYLQTRKISEYRIYLFIPLFLGATLSLITIELWNIFSDSIYLGGISRLIGISPLLVTLVWLTLRFFRIIRLMQKMLTFTVVCYFFIFPIGILLTLAQILQDQSLEIVALILFLVGLIPLVILILYYFIVGLVYIIKLPQQAPKQNFEAYKYLNLKAYARWLNSTFFLISFYALSYFAINEPETATGTKKGTIIGLLVIHIFLFIQTNIALGYKAQDQNNNFAAITQTQDQKQKNSDYYFLACQGGIVLPFIILLPLALILDGTDVINETTFNALVACSIGIPLTFAYFYVQIKMRRESSQYQNFLHPFFVFLIWIFLLGPIGVIIPILADIFQNESSEFALFAQLAVAYTIIAIILAVTFNAVFYSILLNKEYLEMKKKEVLKTIMLKLVGDGIYSSEDVLALVFLRYLQEANPNKLKEDLVKNGDPVNIWVDKDHKQKYNGFEYDIILVSKQDFESRLKLVMIEEHKKQVYRARRRQLRELKAKQEAEGKKEEEVKAELLKLQENQLQEKNEKDKLNESCMGLITNCLYQFFFCKYGYLELEEYDKYLIQELEEKKKQKEIEKKNEQRNKAKARQVERRSTIKAFDEEKADFKESLIKNFPDRAERFWLGVYTEFNNKFSTLLEIFELERDDELMQKVYKSFQKVGDDFTISVEDFALFLHYQFTENYHESYHELLYDTATRYYKIILANHKEVLTICKIRNSNTAFHHFDASQYPLEEDKKLFKLDLNELNMIFQKLGFENYSKPNWIQIKLWKFCQEAHKIIWILPIKYTQQIMGFISSSFFPKLQIPEIKIDPKNEGWEKVAEDLSDTLVSECDKFEEKMQYQDIILKFSITNILALIFKFYDIYSLATLAFKPQVGWSGEDQVFDPVQTVDFSIIWNEYNFFFSLALLLSVIYIVFGIKASQQIKTNTFGYDEKGDIAGWKHFNFWLSKTISFISGQFIFVMKTFIDSIICDYTSYPYTLVRQPIVECMSDVHFIYVVFAILGCGIYYPLTTYLQPTFQYMDNSLDLKYQSSFVVILSQGKLLILGLSSVFSNLEAKAYLYQMLFSSIIIIILIIFQFKMFPCYVRWFNFIDLGLLSILFYFYFGAFLVMASGNPQVGIYFLLSFGLITIIVISVILFRKYRLASTNNNTQQIYPGKNQSETSVLKS